MGVAGAQQLDDPLVGVVPRSGHWLHHLAFEIGRSPDGSFFVLGDRAQAPSGSGFALENRVASSRVFAIMGGRVIDLTKAPLVGTV